MHIAVFQGWGESLFQYEKLKLSVSTERDNFVLHDRFYISTITYAKSIEMFAKFEQYHDLVLRVWLPSQ